MATLVLALAIPGTASATVFNCPAGDAACLISAINTANGTAEADTIILAAGAYSLTAVDNHTDGPNGLPSITGPLTIQGAGGSLTVIQRDPSLGTFPLAEPLFRILHVAASGTVTLEALMVRNGTVNSSPGGGGILNLGTTTIASSTLANNVDSFGNGGGGIRNSGTLILTESHVRGNFAILSDAGGIQNSGTLIIDHSTLSDNHSHLNGGAMLNQGVAFIKNSTIVRNFGDHGGGISNSGGTLTITSSTIAGNISFFGPGGGINLISGSVSLNASTVADNVVNTFGAHGGGINNDGGVVELQNTILARNTVLDPIVLDPPGPDCTGTITSLGSNLVGDPSDCTIALLASDLTGDPGLDSYQEDGTPGKGHVPLLRASQAVDEGDPASCTPTDQLGNPRVDGDGNGTVICDIGAVEFVPAVVVNQLVTLVSLTQTRSQAPVPGGPAGVMTIRATFKNTSSTPIDVPFFVVTELSEGNLLLNADGSPGGVGAKLTPDVGAAKLFEPGESFTTEFVVGLQSRRRFRFFVDLWGGAD